MEDSNKIEMSENESSFSACKGHALWTKLPRKATIRHGNGQNDSMLYGEKQPHGLSKRLPRNELKYLRS